jgi:hypothetical protein
MEYDYDTLHQINMNRFFIVLSIQNKEWVLKIYL